MAGLFFWNTGGAESRDVRIPAMAGTFYPASGTELSKQIDSYLQEIKKQNVNGKIIGIVSPHAGYVYSGQIAAHAYKQIQDESYDVVVLMGNAHRVGFTGASIDGVEAYQTPLGNVPVDMELARKLVSEKNDVEIDSTPHIDEHSLEVQVPFLQKVLKKPFKILPILFGYRHGRAFSYLIQKLPEHLEGKKALVIASTDLTHFPKYQDACRIDRKTAEAIASMDPQTVIQIEAEEMRKSTPGLECVLCGSTATRAVMEISKILGADQGELFQYANSGDIVEETRDRVVGYAAIGFIDVGENGSQTVSEHQQSMKGLTEKEKKTLLGLSRYVLKIAVKGKEIEIKDPADDIFKAKRGAFVTLKIDDRLRGCIGYILPHYSLWKSVIDNTVSASSKDPRFPPVTMDELDKIEIEISALTPPYSVSSYEDIQIGRDGIILRKDFHQAVFLPQVATEQGWDLKQTLSHLSMKAGLRRDEWKSASFEVFQAEVFNEADYGRQEFEDGEQPF